ncbi:hypothetical protein KR222_002798, partial [Zaprionus bogoriensis]
RVKKFPETLPNIDWHYYETNVRKEYVSWVKDFQKKYDSVDSLFANRYSMIDTSKYFGELTQKTKEMKEEVKKYKVESEKRIKILQQRIEYLKKLPPYTEMTMEEFCLAHPEEAPDFINKPTFWPHTPEEQKPGPVEEHVHADECHEGDKPDPDKTAGGKTDPGKSDPGKTPPGGKQDESRDSELVETASEVATKVLATAQDLAAKAVVLLKGLWAKAMDKKKERDAAKSKEAPKVKHNEKFSKLDRSSEICSKTKIRGDDTAEADVKAHHVDLTTAGDSDSALREKCEREEKEKQLREKCEREEKERQLRERCEKEEKEKQLGAKCEKEEKEKQLREKCEREEKERQLRERCEREEKEKQLREKCEREEKEKQLREKCERDEKERQLRERCEREEKEKQLREKCEREEKERQLRERCEREEKEKQLRDKCEREEKERQLRERCEREEKEKQLREKCEREEKAKATEKQQPAKQQPAKTAAPQVESKQTPKICDAEDREGNVGGPPKQTAPQCKDNEAVKEKAAQPEPAKEGREAQTEVLKKPDGSKVNIVDRQEMGPAEMARVMFKMALGSAKMLSEAKGIIDRAHLSHRGNPTALERAYKEADKEVVDALNQSREALALAEKLRKQAKLAVPPDDQKVVETINKHAVLAKLLANRATVVRQNIVKLLDDLKKMK